MRKGKRLQVGDTIGLVAPASPVSIERIQTAIAILRRLGFRVKTGESAGKVYGGYMVSTPLERAVDLHAMFADDDVRAILCLRGGYGATQILPYLDLEWIRENPKLFIGYSDITALHIAFQQKCGIATIHGPMAAVEFIKEDDLSVQSLLQLASTGVPAGSYTGEAWSEGAVTAPLTGGNLSLICALMGTPFEIDTSGKILFLEEVHEEPYAIDRMLTQLQLSGKLDDASGFVLGNGRTVSRKHMRMALRHRKSWKNFFAGSASRCLPAYNPGTALRIWRFRSASRSHWILLTNACIFAKPLSLNKLIA